MAFSKWRLAGAVWGKATTEGRGTAPGRTHQRGPRVAPHGPSDREQAAALPPCAPGANTQPLPDPGPAETRDGWRHGLGGWVPVARAADRQAGHTPAEQGHRLAVH